MVCKSNGGNLDTVDDTIYDTDNNTKKDNTIEKNTVSKSKIKIGNLKIDLAPEKTKRILYMILL